MLKLTGQRGQARSKQPEGSWRERGPGTRPMKEGGLHNGGRARLTSVASAPLPPPGCLLACPDNPPAGATVCLHTPCPVSCQGRPRSWADVSLADTGMAERSWNEVQKGHGAGTEENSGPVSQPKVRRDARPQGPQRQACRGAEVCGASLGTLGGVDVVRSLSVAGHVLHGVGMLVLLPNLGSSWSYKLHSSLRPRAGLPCFRVIRDHPDCTSVAAHDQKILCRAGFNLTRVRGSLSSTKECHFYRPRSPIRTLPDLTDEFHCHLSCHCSPPVSALL